MGPPGVRDAAITATRLLATDCRVFAEAALESLVDMLNDDINSV